jgi:hypothetical protein
LLEPNHPRIGGITKGKSCKLLGQWMSGRLMLQSAGLKAIVPTGRDNVKTPTSINTILLADDYWEFVEFGRKADKKRTH